MAIPQIEWRTHPGATAVHALSALVCGRKPLDQRLADILAQPAEMLAEAIELGAAPKEALLEHLCGLSSTAATQPRQLAATAVAKTLGPGAPLQEQLVERIARSVVDAEKAIHQALPRLADELVERIGPLRMQWEARGPGLATEIGQIVEPDLLVERAVVVLVHPILGGAGAAHWQYNSVRIEALLADADAQLPETLRLAWLLSQLNLDLPKYADMIAPERRRRVGVLTMAAVVLAASDRVELAALDRTRLAKALESWPMFAPADDEEIDCTLAWYEEYAASRPRWSVALAAFDRMLAAR